MQTENRFITVPEMTLPSGIVVPSFLYGQFACSKGADGKAVITEDGTPWVNISFVEAKAACADIGGQLVTETQELAIRLNAAQQDCNWTKGKVGEGKLFRGLRKGNVSSAQPGTFQSPDAKERRWHQLSNGEKIYDFSGNCFTWIFDDVQGDENGLTGKIADDSISLTTAPYPSKKRAWDGVQTERVIGLAMRSCGAAAGTPTRVPVCSISAASAPGFAATTSASAAPRVSDLGSQVAA